MADFDYITDRGVIVPDASDIRRQVEEEWKAAFGQDLVVTPESPQGVIITTQVEIRDGVARNNAELANQINPDLAGGVFLDAIWRMTGGMRRPATRSTVSGVVFSGVRNTQIPRGSIVTGAGVNSSFRTVGNLIIGSDGAVTGDVEAVEFGPVQASPGQLSSVGTSVLGWESVTNPNSAVVGRDIESDMSARARRINTLALQTISQSEAITSALYGMSGVRSLSFRENTSHETQIIDGISMAPHSIYACVEGGTDAGVAETLAQEKTIGAGYNGGVSVVYVDPYSNQSYAVLFDRPEEVSIFARITVSPSVLDVQTIVPRIIQDYINGNLEEGTGLTVGSPVSAFELSGVINQAEPRIFVRDIQLSLDGLTWSHNTISIGIDQVARLPESSIQVITA